MTSFFSILLETRRSNILSNHRFMTYLKEAFEGSVEKLRKTIPKMKETLLLQAKNQQSPKLSACFILDIESVFTKMNSKQIDIYIPKDKMIKPSSLPVEETHHLVYMVCHPNKSIEFVMDSVANKDNHNLVMNYICKSIPEVSEMMTVLEEEFDNNLLIDFSIKNNGGTTECQFVLTIFYTLPY